MRRLIVGAAALYMATLQTAWAGPADYVFTPAVEYGERELDFKYGSARKTDSDERKSAASLGFGYGATTRWFTEVYVKYTSEGGDRMRYDALEWENRFQLTETGEYPVDVGLITELERPRDRAEGYEFKWGPLFQTEFGKLQVNANLLLERHYRAQESGHAEMGYQLQAKHRWLREFEYGLQAFGELGKWNDWSPSSAQTHRIGPAVFGKLAFGERRAIRYNAALLFGVTRATPDHTFRLQTEFEF